MPSMLENQQGKVRKTLKLAAKVMNKAKLKNFFLNLIILIIIFLIDRISKLYILKLAELESSVDIERGHQHLLSNVLAQANVLALGSLGNLNAYKNCEGNRPSNLISWETTDPYTIGRLLALYEYITIVCGFIWNINSFDQWGVESGKILAKELMNSESLSFS